MHLKDDVHREHNLGNPIQRFKDRTTSFALEDTQRLTDKFDLVFGVSRDERGTREAQNLVAGKLVNFQKDETDAWNPQIGVFYRPGPSDEIYVTLSRKAVFQQSRTDTPIVWAQRFPMPVCRRKVPLISRLVLPVLLIPKYGWKARFSTTTCRT